MFHEFTPTFLEPLAERKVHLSKGRHQNHRWIQVMNRLLTIPISHYCEKARWALDRARISYREEQHIQVLHWLATRRESGTRTVPVLTHPGGTLTESTDIVRWACPELFAPPEATSEVDRLDAWGVHTRAWVYHRVLPHEDLIRRFNAPRVPLWQKATAPAFYKALRPFMKRHLKIDEAQISQALGEIERVMDDVEERRRDGRRFLLGDTFTAADLTAWLPR